MNPIDVQNALEAAITSIIGARAEVNSGNDDTRLADIARDMVEAMDGVAVVRTYARVQMLTSDAGLVVRMDDGSEFQISIVQSK